MCLFLKQSITVRNMNADCLKEIRDVAEVESEVEPTTPKSQ